VQKGLDFQLVAPSSLAGLPQGEVRSIEVDGRDAVLTTYGKGLGGIAVIESASEPGGEKGGSGPEGGLSLPKIPLDLRRGHCPCSRDLRAISSGRGPDPSRKADPFHIVPDRQPL